MTTRYSLILLPALALALGGCAVLPDRQPALEDARAAVNAAQADPQVATYAGLELGQANEALRRADAAWRDRADLVEVDHLAYLAWRRAAIAIEAARLRSAETEVVGATAERDRVLLVAREREAARAQQEAARAQMEAEASRRRADEARVQAAQAQQDAATAQAQAAISQQQALDAEARTRALAAQLDDLQAQRTDRGMVITLGDVLFATGRAELSPGGFRVLQKLADFLKRYPERTVAIEGFTDSTGSDAYNLDLSERRANAVRLALLDLGVEPSRIAVRGYGKAFPVAGNETAAGRQLNRRVEVVISDDNGTIAPRPSSPVRVGNVR